MIAFILNRLFQALIVMLVVALLAFCMCSFIGDPARSMLSEDATAEQYRELKQNLGLDDPVIVQFARFVRRAVRADFGISYRNAIPVSKLIAERLPATVELVVCASLLALAFGVPMGVYTGLRRTGWLSRTIQSLSLTGISLPSFVTGIFLILFFSVILGWLPSYGRGDVLRLAWWSTGFLTASGLKALILPSITLSIFQLTLIMRLVRAEILEVMRTDYIKFARARGLPDRIVHFKYGLKGALVPVVTVIGLQIGSLIAFAIVTETVFQWPGMGSLFIQAVSFGDIPVMSAYLVVVSLIFVVMNLVVDLSYFLIDPRLSSTRSR
jgi:peptide/nickel transport system permease protein